MLLQRSRLDATVIERPRLAPPWLIAVLGTLVIVVLVAIYPHQALIRRVLSAPFDGITEAYLNNLLRTDPDNPSLRLLLARNQLKAGLHEKVRETLAPYIGAADPELRQEALWLLWQGDEQRLHRLHADSPAARQLRQDLVHQLETLTRLDWSDDFLATIARKAIGLGGSALAIEIFVRLAHGSSGKSDVWYAEAAQTALANGEYRAAAEFHLIAGERSPSLADRRHHFMSAMRALQSGDRLPEALALAEKELQKAPALAKDGEILEQLVHLARAGGRPDLAEKYARRLLRLSLLEQWRRQQLAASGFDGAFRRVGLSAEELRGGPQLPFDDRIYTLGFEAFLGNRNVEDAWKVAASAVHQAPDSLSWRERLARVSEWSGRPKIALENWIHIARATDGDEAWQAVLRLAPGLFDDEALLAALKYQAGRQPAAGKWWRELVATYERLGQPDRALQFLGGLYERSRQPALLEPLAELAERAGDVRLALRYWRAVVAGGEVGSGQAIHVATLMLLQGLQEEALALLEKARRSAPADDTDYWRLLGQLSRVLQKDDAAVAAYRTLVEGSKADATDYDALCQLLAADHPREAAQVAISAWQRFRQPVHLVQALVLLADRQQWAEIGRLLAGLDSATLATLRRQADFLRISAQYHRQTGELRLAQDELAAALRLAPDSASIQQALLWALIDANDATALRRLLAGNETTWQANPALHDALGSAYLALSLPDIALRRYYTPRVAEHRDDFLWLMNYADALEQNQEAERAWQLRRHLLAGERRTTAAGGWLDSLGSTDLAALRRAARTRLNLALTPGDLSLSALRELLRLDRDGSRQLSPAARDIALAWWQEHGEYAAERGWLWQQYAKATSRPQWAEITLALADGDLTTAGDLLDRSGERLPRYDRINAATRLDDVRLAQSDAFATSQEQPADDPLHQQLGEALLAHADDLGGGSSVRHEAGSLRERQQAARWHLSISPRLTLDLAGGHITRRNDNPAVIGVTPDESYGSARLVWRHRDGETRLTAESRHSFDTYNPLQIEHEQQIDARLSFALAVAARQPATESTALRVAGMKDIERLGLRYRPTERDQIYLEHRWQQYATQTGTEVGNGQVWQFEAAHALRREPRSLEASVFSSHQQFGRRQTGDIFDARLDPLRPAGLAAADLGNDFFLPQNFRYHGIRLSTDTRFARDYTRAWRPYATVARTWHSNLGAGYDLAAGIAGSVFGADHLSFGWKLAKGGANTVGLVREIGLTYRIHY